MHLAIFGATGRTGRLTVTQALEQGHQVTAFVRSAESLPLQHPELETAVMPVLDPGLLRSRLAEADAVLSALGGSVRHGSPARVWTAEIIEAMNDNGVRRLLVTSAAPIGVSPSRRPLAYKILSWVLRDVYEDLAGMENAVMDSSLDWTVVRPPRLTNGPRTGRYRTAVGENVASGYSVSRADLADALLTLAENPDTSKWCVGVAY